MVVRYGGDEFLCAMPNMSRAGALQRMEAISVALAETNPGQSITYGLAEFEPADGLLELVGRADADLLAARSPRGRGE